MPNESFIHADIFFFISTLGIIGLAILFGIILVYLIRILKIVHHLAEKLEEEIENANDRLTSTQVRIKESGIGEIFALIGLGVDWLRRHKKKKH